jgi:nicotinamide riboside transporter PnuC
MSDTPDLTVINTELADIEKRVSWQETKHKGRTHRTTISELMAKNWKLILFAGVTLTLGAYYVYTIKN